MTDHPNATHGQSWTPEWVSWVHMRQRCNNPNRGVYKNYGGRGIKVCERWDDFANFLADMGPKPGKGYSIERKDNDGDYEPINCIWATKLEQNRNRRGTYTADEDQQIRDAIALGMNFTQIARHVGKPKGSVVAHAYRIGLKSGQPVRKTMP